MISIELPELGFQEVALETEMSVKKGGEDAGEPFPKRLEGRVSLGVPMSVPIDAALVADDKELSHFINSKSPEADFYLVHLACTLHPAEDSPFNEAWLIVKLERSDGVQDSRPIAWSLTPSIVGKDVKLTNTVKLGGSLKFMDAGVEMSTETGKERTDEKIFLQAFGVLESDPFWEFSRIEGKEIRGSYSFAMIVQTQKNAKARGSVSLRANIKRKWLGIPYRTDFSDASPLLVEMP